MATTLNFAKTLTLRVGTGRLIDLALAPAATTAKIEWLWQVRQETTSQHPAFAGLSAQHQAG
tara:strand:+ start:74 stop:259 length:186 start_codon:yes stop_codon:yes gene_type:complete